MSVGAILPSVLAVLLLGIIPAWPQSASISFYPLSGGLCMLSLISVMLLARNI